VVSRSKGSRKTGKQCDMAGKTCLPDLRASWHAPNRVHNLRTYFTSDNPRAVRRIEAKPAWISGLDLANYGLSSSVRSPPITKELV